MFTQDQLSLVLEQALSTGGDWADVFIEESAKNRVTLSDKKIKNVAANLTAGAGVRVVKDNKEYYAFTNNLTIEGMKKAAKELSEAVSDKKADQKISLQGKTDTNLFIPEKNPKDILWDHKVTLVKKADDITRGISQKIIQVNVDYTDEVQRILVANSSGLFKEDKRTRGRFAVTAVAGDGTNKEVGYEAPGALKGFEFFEGLNLATLCKSSAETALTMLTAPHAPQGRMTVIIDSGFGGVIFHEACGHSLEAAAVSKKATVFAESLGKQIASPLVSAVDDGTLSQEWGSSSIDDEGTPTQRNLLIENGILKSFLVDRLNGDRIGQKSTGSARRQAYNFSPTSRMNNTFILPGKDSLAEMIAGTEYGIYAKKLGGGSVNPATGEFNFAVTEGYLIKNGKIVSPVKGAVLIGRGDEVLQKIDAVGNNLKLAQGMCGAASGWVPVNVGQPALRVRDILVGGQ